MISLTGESVAMAFRIYTKTGDDGSTGLFGGQRVAKDSLRIESYGTVDELNSFIGVVRAQGVAPEHDTLLGEIQETLFVLGSDLATPIDREPSTFVLPRVTAADIECLELAIDRMEESLPPLKSFILPGGAPAGAMLHVARTVCRRAERRVVALQGADSSVGVLPVQYLNRLSDLLFVLARAVNHASGVEEHPWTPRAEQDGRHDS
jgi:cob(I)alamin adenosyltransferase